VLLSDTINEWTVLRSPFHFQACSHSLGCQSVGPAFMKLLVRQLGSLITMTSPILTFRCQCGTAGWECSWHCSADDWEVVIFVYYMLLSHSCCLPLCSCHWWLGRGWQPVSRIAMCGHCMQVNMAVVNCILADQFLIPAWQQNAGTASKGSSQPRVWQHVQSV